MKAAWIVMILGGAVHLALGMGGGPEIPPWVSAPDTVEQEYPRARFFSGIGVCAGANARDLMSRKQAESLAVSDIASVVEVSINNTIEDISTDVERNGRHLSQEVRIQTTKRVVTGILSGVEIKDVFYDERSMNWYALAVLDRAKAGRGAVEAVAQRIRKADTLLVQPPAGPVADVLMLRSLRTLQGDLERLAVAVAIFAPASRARVDGPIEVLRAQVDQRLLLAKTRANVRVEVEGIELASQEPVRRAVVTALKAMGLGVVHNAEALCRVSVTPTLETQVGAARVFKAYCGARFTLSEGDHVLADGEVPGLPAQATRASSRRVAQERSVRALAPRLETALQEALQRRLTWDGS